MMTPRDELLALFESGCAAVAGDQAVARALAGRPRPDRVWIFAVGKAAVAMVEGARVAWGEHIERGWVVVPHGTDITPLAGDTRWFIQAAGHPEPDAGSLAAGDAVLRGVAALPADCQPLYLISGGSSALLEVLRPPLRLVDLQRINADLLAGGWPITTINAVRRRLSRVKGGGLRPAVGSVAPLALYISDVPGDDPAVIGSGLVVEPAPNARPEALPAEIPAWFDAFELEASPVDARAPVEHVVVADLTDACRGVVTAAERRGRRAFFMPPRLRGEAAPLGEALADTLVSGPAGVFVWGGEPTVTLPADPGNGGRAQALALAAARRFAEASRDARTLALLAGGTDGRDGPTEAAGGVVDPQTVARGQAAGGDAASALACADAGGFLARSGDRLVTGPTGTNVTDLVIGWVGP